MVGIYKITSPSGKIYIGQSVNIEKRFLSYSKLLRCKTQIKLFRSFLKYEVINHKFEIIEECDIELLNERERYYQDLYDVINKGLNCVLQELNGKSGKLSEETKLKIGLAFSKEVYQYSLDNNFIRKFNSCSEVERILNINKSSVASCCRFKRKSAGGYKWYYEKQNN